MSRRQRGEVLRLILSLASRPDGVSRAELADRIVLASNTPILSAACKRGHIFSAKRPGQRLRYFITEQNAAEWLAREPEPAPEKVKPPKPEKPALPPKKPKPLPHQALTVFPPKPPPEEAKPRGEAIRTEKTVETRDTTVRPTAKWQMQDLPPDPRYPSFSSMRPGVDPRTGKAWEGRA